MEAEETPPSADAVCVDLSVSSIGLFVGESDVFAFKCIQFSACMLNFTIRLKNQADRLFQDYSLKGKMMKEIIRLRKNNQYSMIQRQFGGNQAYTCHSK